MSDVGLSDCFGDGFGKVLDQAGHESPTQVPQPPRVRQRKNIRGEVSTMLKHKHGVWCLEREEHGRVSRGMLETEHCLQEREKEREKVRVGPGLRECEAGYEIINC